MALQFVDSHCHLDRLKLDGHGSLEAAIQAARDNGVAHMLCVSINLEQWPGMVAAVEGFEDVSISVGVHPTEREGRDPDVDELLRLASHPKVVAIGETGLDYYHCQGDMGWQHDRLRRHIEAAKQCHKPLIIHTRESGPDTMRILEEEGARDAGGVMHCFVEDREIARRALDIGFYISFSGIVTFKNAARLRDVARQVPMDRILIETDSPYLAPVPFRGKPNEPAYVRHVAEQLAELRGLTLEEIGERTTENFRRLFN